MADGESIEADEDSKRAVRQPSPTRKRPVGGGIVFFRTSLAKKKTPHQMAQSLQPQLFQPCGFERHHEARARANIPGFLNDDGPPFDQTPGLIPKLDILVHSLAKKNAVNPESRHALRSNSFCEMRRSPEMITQLPSLADDRIQSTSSAAAQNFERR